MTTKLRKKKLCYFHTRFIVVSNDDFVVSKGGSRSLKSRLRCVVLSNDFFSVHVHLVVLFVFFLVPHFLIKKLLRIKSNAQSEFKKS